MKVGVLLPRPTEDLGSWLANAAAFDAAGADALWIDITRESGLDPLMLTAALAAITSRSLLFTTAVPQDATLEQLSRGRLRVLASESERWAVIDMPDSRPSWRTAMAEAAERGYQGIVVPAESRLLDLLRNPDDPGERRDLELSVG